MEHFSQPRERAVNNTAGFSVPKGFEIGVQRYNGFVSVVICSARGIIIVRLHYGFGGTVVSTRAS